MRPLVSVIIPVFNVEPYLCECLDSVLRQSYRELEIIIVDDGSTDGSGSICDNYQKMDRRIKVIHQENCGLSAARNTGLNAMHGEIVSFLDSDDAFLPKMIETMVDNMAIANADIVVCGYYVRHIDKHRRKTQLSVKLSKTAMIIPSEEALRSIVKGRINVTVWNKIYKKSLFESLRFEEGHVYEDLLIMPHIIERANKVLIIEDPLVIYRRRSNSISSSRSTRNTIDHLYSKKKMEDYIINNTPRVFTEKHRKMMVSNCSFKGKILYAIYKYNPRICESLLYSYHFIIRILLQIKAVLLRANYD